jgi:hypothetical protein
MPANSRPVFGEWWLRSPTSRPEVPSTISGSTECSWALAGATQKRVITPGQDTLTCTLKP